MIFVAGGEPEKQGPLLSFLQKLCLSFWCLLHGKLHESCSGCSPARGLDSDSHAVAVPHDLGNSPLRGDVCRAWALLHSSSESRVLTDHIFRANQYQLVGQFCKTAGYADKESAFKIL